MPNATYPSVQLREAEEADGFRIWRWRNETAARAASFNTDEIPLETHLQWFSGRFRDPGTRLYIASAAGSGDIGYVRFDLSGAEAEISMCLDSAYRGRGYGRIVIRESALLVLALPGIHRVVALVKPGNQRSLAAFQAAGFKVHGRENRGGVEAWVLHLTRPMEAGGLL